MKYLRHLMLALLLGLGLTTTAQVTISSSDIVGTKWKIQGSTCGNIYEYSTTKKTLTRKNGRVSSYPYYLSDKKETTFDHSKVGKPTRGCYLMEYNEKMDDFDCSEITAFDKEKGIMTLKLVSELPLGATGIGTYELIK